MRVLHAEARDHHLVRIRFPVAVRVLEKLQVIAVLHIHAVFVRQDAERDGDAVHEHARLLHAGGGRRVEDDHAILARAGVERLRLRRAFIAVHRIFKCRHRPHPPVLIPVHRDEFPKALLLLRHQLDLKARRQRERRLFLLARERRRLRALRRSRRRDKGVGGTGGSERDAKEGGEEREVFHGTSGGRGR